MASGLGRPPKAFLRIQTQLIIAWVLKARTGWQAIILIKGSGTPWLAVDVIYGRSDQRMNLESVCKLCQVRITRIGGHVAGEKKVSRGSTLGIFRFVCNVLKACMNLV